MYEGHMFGAGSVFMWIFWVLVIVGVVWLFVFSFMGDTSGKKSALEILKDRYASGDIDRDEFEQRKKDLNST
ncbi:MAG: SHOCT domain-containing protein [Gammaproteobacteria bacterium]|nr:SHOCT domain-containing protein [Gammaproteobacteria bacterium]